MKNVKQTMESNVKAFTVKERIVINLIKFLIKYIGRGTEHFIGFEFDDCFKEDKNENN